MHAITRYLQQQLLYAYDMMFAFEYKDDLERQMRAWCDFLAMFGLKLNVKKTEYLATNLNGSSSNNINDTELASTLVFKQLRSVTASDSG
ncbi:unnamed protein product [Heligmosomoides polygyrus]|uniref:Reverse transcriptase domain-containing protein n=1 Tax=Heligmosomoides polygyrus TaxID=6339 RepID=A0A183FGI7_HELPZ|nr:unnamed protein product [Heligmosomoides polygyrus]